jgi:hypothetical protein
MFIISLYVNDLLIIDSSCILIEKVKDELKKTFEMTVWKVALQFKKKSRVNFMFKKAKGQASSEDVCSTKWCELQ